MEVQQQQRLQVFMDALRDDRNVFDKDILQRLQEAKYPNPPEYETTGTQIANSNRHTRHTIISEHEATRSLPTELADDTLNRIRREHHDTSQYISTEDDELHEAIETGQMQTMSHAEMQHNRTAATTTDSMTDQRISTEENVRSDNQQRIDILKAELFRGQLEG